MHDHLQIGVVNW